MAAIQTSKNCVFLLQSHHICLIFLKEIYIECYPTNNRGFLQMFNTNSNTCFEGYQFTLLSKTEIPYVNAYFEGTNISHLGKREIIFKSTFKKRIWFPGGYVHLCVWRSLTIPGEPQKKPLTSHYNQVVYSPIYPPKKKRSFVHWSSVLRLF